MKKSLKGNAFEVAARNKFTFRRPSGGLVNAQDLLSLGLPELNEIAIALNNQKKSSKVSFISKSKVDEVVDAKLEVVKHVIACKQEDAAVRSNATANRQEEQKLMGALANKQEQALGELSEEEIEKRLKKLRKK